ncbi:A-kinase anchor protein 10, mitochondrial [Galleria mellonella]|uniref:A-kinase anchor protein 10, mitochondrial n=1 Tax=Galleria mellonella TaxID=7137 RepID=A0A6J1WYV8_GALME|nr:A-kinase anchor protein 10, mitochondrial [Galleria mellonella]
MIKFWKSAAKGKSGCPVRPPEPSTSSMTNTNLGPSLDTQLKDENQDQSHIFIKKSKLSLNLHDILIEKRSIKHFILFMETIGKNLLIKCWLELDNFKTMVSNTYTNHSIETENHTKISRAKSFDFQCKCKLQKEKEFMTQKYKEKNENYMCSSDSRRKSDYSTSSCLNLAEYENSVNCEVCEKNKKISDLTEVAIELFKKYVALEAPYHLDLPDSLRKSVISNICDPEGRIKEDCFKPIQEVIFNQIDNNYFNDFLNSPYYIKAQIDILTSGSLDLIDILYNDTILFYFTEYLEQESCTILLEFLMAVTHFRDNLMNGNSLNPDQAQTDAIVLYDKYFSLQAISPVGFPTDIRLQIESNICREGGPLHTCFDISYQIVFNTLRKYVKTFFESELYYKYLSEMVHSVDQTWSSNHKSQSDCSSEISISTQNTLLAMGDPVFRKKKRNLSVPDMTIDSNQLYNADALWQRKRHDGLSLGRVNSLGRFESKFEPDPDKKDKSVLKKMVSRFVPVATSKVEEEMAWQIAHMIVKDVTDLTMAPPENEHDASIIM